MPECRVSEMEELIDSESQKTTPNIKRQDIISEVQHGAKFQNHEVEKLMNSENSKTTYNKKRQHHL